VHGGIKNSFGKQPAINKQPLMLHRWQFPTKEKNDLSLNATAIAFFCTGTFCSGTFCSGADG
jgi:hypothetical protein